MAMPATVHASSRTVDTRNAAFTPAFGALALIGLIPAYYLLRSLQDKAPGHRSRRSPPGG